MGSLPVFRPSCPGGAVYKFRASTGNYPFPVGGSGGVSSSGRGSLSGRSGADGRLRPVRLANGGRRGRSGAGAGAPPVSNFYQFPVVFTQFPAVGPAQADQFVDVGGSAVVPVPQVVQFSAVDGGVAPYAPCAALRRFHLLVSFVQAWVFVPAANTRAPPLEDDPAYGSIR